MALYELRRQGRRPQFSAAELRDEPGLTDAEGESEADAHCADPLARAISDEEVLRVHAAVDALPERYRLPLVYAPCRNWAAMTSP
ncbi:MAG: hypothetical protein ABIP38_09215 [Steroidobacteraceae bacterium]